MRDVALIGAGVTRFAKFLDKSLKDLAREAIDKSRLQAAVVGNATGGPLCCLALLARANSLILA